MSDPSPPSSRFRFDDPRQERIYDRLRRLVSEGAASFFRDACQLFAGIPSLETASHMSAHALREVESALRQILEPIADGVSAPKNRPRAHANSIQKVCTALGVAADDQLRVEWARFAGDNNLDGFAGRAHRDDIRRARAIDVTSREWFGRVAAVFDAVLQLAEGKYALIFKALDELLAKPTPDPADLTRITRTVPNTALAHGYFFERLEHAGWLGPLLSTELLTSAAPLDRDEDAGTIGFPTWPPAPFLMRMAKRQDPRLQILVLKALKRAPDTDNTRVHAEVASIATELLPDLARELVPFIESGLRKPYNLLVPHYIPPLVEHLAVAGLVEEASSLARTLLELLPDLDPPKGADNQFSATPRPRIHDQLYDHHLRKIAEIMIGVDPWQAVAVLTDLADAAMRLSEPVDSDGIQDLSHIWWRELGSEEADLYEPRTQLLEALRHAAVAVATRNPERVPELIQMLEARRWLVFKRIALHVLAMAPAAPLNLCLAAARDVSLYEDRSTKREYLQLLRAHLGHVPSTDRDELIALIDAAPDAINLRKSINAWRDQPVDDKEFAVLLRRARYERLRPIADYLPLEQQLAYKILQAEFGTDSDDPSSVHREDRSPRDAANLLQLSDDELINYLRTSNLGHERLGPSIEGLADALATACSQSPERLASLSDQLVDTDPTLISGLLRGLEVAIRNGTPIEWQALVRLCRWVIDQPRAIPGRKTPYSDLDPGWAWTRRQIASLLVHGLENQLREIPIALRSEVWPIIVELLADADPDLGRSTTDAPDSVALNSVRGQAMSAAILYAAWIRRNNLAPDGFASMTDVGAALDRHLDPAVEASPAIRSVYGERLRFLIYVDSSWTLAAIPRIFPEADTETSLWDAAWSGYVQFGGFVASVATMLEPQYRRATRALCQTDNANQRASHDEHRLAEHLMIMLWRGDMTALDQTGTIAEFFRNAAPQLRGYAIRYIGILVRDADADFPIERLDRVRELWAARFDAARQSRNPQTSAEEIKKFGAWVTCARFDSRWSLEQLKDVLLFAGTVDREDQVLERLVELAPSHPLLVTECLDLIVQSCQDHWTLQLSAESIRAILSAVFASGDQAVRMLAIEVVNRLLARGHHAFRDLLS